MKIEIDERRDDRVKITLPNGEQIQVIATEHPTRGIGFEIRGEECLAVFPAAANCVEVYPEGRVNNGAAEMVRPDTLQGGS